MIAILTGDMIASRKQFDTNLWLLPLKAWLALHFGEQGIAWDIYRGDSFQLKLSRPAEALKTAIQIKSMLKQTKGIDVRIAIGIGNENYTSQKIMESQGSAFIRSGELVDKLKKRKQSMAISTGNENLDDEVNLIIRLLLLTLDHWSPAEASLASLIFAKTQPIHVYAQKLSISISTTSERKKRAHLQEIIDAEQFIRSKIESYEQGMG
jgi:hypothetical protein